MLLAILALLAVLVARVDAAPEVPPDPIQDDADVLETEEPEVAEPAPVIAPIARLTAPIPASAVVAAAYRAADLDHDPGPSWRRRSRLAGLVPMFSVRDGRDAAWRDVSDPTLGYVATFDVSATWHLDRLLFDPNELRIASIEVSRRRARRRLATLAIRTYYQWLEARAAVDHGPRWSNRADELAAELDGLTDGWFSHTLGKRPEP